MRLGRIPDANDRKGRPVNQTETAGLIFEDGVAGM
jgi:hypothetical protein